MNLANVQRPLAFGSDAKMIEIAREFGSPVLVHNEDSYRQSAREALRAPNAFGIHVRYAMKANSHRVILRILSEEGIDIDASSYAEVKRAIAAGIEPHRIELTSQMPLASEELREIMELGVIYNATSLLQLRNYARLFAGSDRPFSVRINPGLGSGHNNRTNTAGLAASFGIWHEYLPEVLSIAKDHSLKITHLHTHVGSGSDWTIWQKASRLTLGIARRMPDVETVNLGGGYKIDRIDAAKSIDFRTVFPHVKESFEEFAADTGRKLKLEIEPGTYLSANSCILVSRVCDVVDTGREGYNFIKLDASMTELLRPMIYGARHPFRLLGKSEDSSKDYVIVGTCCESGDIFSPREGDPEEVDTVTFPEAAIGDYLAIMGVGAYGISMSAKNYNSRPICAEVLIRYDGSHVLISRQQEIEEIWARELDIE